MIVPIMAYSNFKKLFILYTDTSEKGIEAVLHKKNDQDKERIIVCVSRTLNQHEKITS